MSSHLVDLQLMLNSKMNQALLTNLADCRCAHADQLILTEQHTRRPSRPQYDDQAPYIAKGFEPPI